jgi:fermentation-respiration switch protein FrsA (DUF1100 family)
MGKWRRLGVVLAVMAVLVLSGWGSISRYARAVQLLDRLSHPSAAQPALAAEDVTIAGKNGPIRARLYFRRDRPRSPGLVVAHGVHYRGIDEARLVPFAKALAESGLTVLTPELADLADYRITERSVDVMRDSVAYLTKRRDHVLGERVGLLGFSFAGGLALVAGEDPETADRLSFITSVGGHHDLRHVLRFLIHDEIETPTGVVHQHAHDYGLIVVVYGNLERFVPSQDLSCTREGFRNWLHGDQAAAREAAKACTSPEAKHLWQLLEQQKLQELAPQLDQALETQRGALAHLSAAGHLRELERPVYLLHGAHDSVIPPSETNAANLELASLEHRALVTPLIEHVEVTKSATWSQELELVSFMANLL